jgi:hypothetical protein
MAVMACNTARADYREGSRTRGVAHNHRASTNIATNCSCSTMGTGLRATASTSTEPSSSRLKRGRGAVHTSQSEMINRASRLPPLRFTIVPLQSHGLVQRRRRSNDLVDTLHRLLQLLPPSLLRPALDDGGSVVCISNSRKPAKRFVTQCVHIARTEDKAPRMIGSPGANPTRGSVIGVLA